MDDRNLDRYLRQTVLPELRIAGQKRLRNASVLCIGVGGLGCPALLYLAASGIGRLGLVDHDHVDISNLQRQILFREKDHGVLKVEAAAHILNGINATCVIDVFPERFTLENAESLVASYDVVIDGTDNFASKFLINDVCVKQKKPLIYSSILGFDAQVSVFYAEKGPCYRCLFPAPPEAYIPNCAEAGILGAIAGIAGSIQALEALKMVLGLDWCQDHKLQPLLGRLWILDARTMQTKTLQVHKNTTCSVCSLTSENIFLHETSALCSAHHNATPVSVYDAKNFIGKAIFIDVREVSEWSQKRIPTAISVPLDELISVKKEIDGIPLEKLLIVYCQHGVRSQRAASHLKKLGYANALHLEGGIAQWEGAILCDS